MKNEETTKIVADTIKKEADNEVEDASPPDESKLTAFQLEERRKRTCFVGNLPMEISAKNLKSVFTQSGFKVEKLWFRSIAI